MGQGLNWLVWTQTYEVGPGLSGTGLEKNYLDSDKSQTHKKI